VSDGLYRDYIIEWCGEMSETLNRVCGQLNDETLQQFEEQLLVLKRNAELKDAESNERELFTTATNLYEELSGYFEHSDLALDHQERQRIQPVPIGGHRLPPLPYTYDALEPVIDKEIMRLHHSKHHQSYVDGLNKAEKEMQKTRESGDYTLIKHWQREAAFHGSGHYLHTIFWNIMSPNGGGNPKRQVKEAITVAFGSFEKFKKHFSEAAKNVEASGWAILVWSPRAHRMEILTAEKHQNLTQWDVIPLLVLDVWEHAYYLQYKNERAKYVEKWWDVVNWDEVEKRFAKAKTIIWQPF
jgi:Fe-Mn family superoxide dismutase